MSNRPISKILVTTGLILLWALAVIAVVLAEAVWFAHPTVTRGDVASIENHLAQKLQAAAARQKLGSAGLVLVQGGKIVAEHGFGVANAETQAPVKTDQTLYILGSVSKAVTAWGVMKLVEEGKLRLDEPIMRHLKRWRFPGSEAWRDKVTVRHLLSHTAGIDDGFGFSGFLPGEAIQTIEESLTYPKDTNSGEPHGVIVAREPGMAMSYSSAGYTVLQLLIEEVTNRSFADYMKETVLQPLGMTKSSFDLDAITTEGRAQNLATSYDSEMKPHPHRRYTAQAAVSLRATPHDLAQFVLAYTGANPVLRPETLKQMMTPQPGTGATWGLGQTLYVENDAGGYVVGHAGGAFPASGASVRVNPATGNGFVLMASGGRGATNQLAHDWVYWETGKVTFEGRRQIAQNRIVPASVAIILGVIVIVLWRLQRMPKVKLQPLVFLFAWLLCFAVHQSLAQAQPPTAPPSLVAEAGRTVPASRGGNALSFQIASKILKETRRILVVLPGSYAQSAPERRYPVMVVVDGEYLIAPVAAVSDELSRNGQIPESVIVSIENVGGVDFMASNNKRVYDLTPPGLSVSGSNLNQGGDLFLDFIEKELLPAVDRQFRTAAPRAFVGVSSGGVLATYVAATRATYCAVVALDAPIHLGNNWLAKKLIARKAVGSMPVRYASLEAKFGWPEEEWKTLVAGAPAAWKLYREKLPLEGHETMQMLGAYLGLRQVFSDYSRFSAPEAPTTSILPYYAKVSAALGATVIPPRRLLQNVVEDLLMEGRGAAAREAYNTLVAGYGAPPNSEKLLAQIAEVERRPPPTETVEGLLATPFPTPEEARRFIGDWIGDVWLNPDEPRTGKLTLRIRVEKGQVIGETVRRTESGEERTNRVEYLKVTPTGLTYGFMNGMRPRGVALFEGTLQGDTLSGEMRFGGINFKEKGPPLKFSFKRAAR